MLSGADIVMEMYQKGELEQAGNVFTPGAMGNKFHDLPCAKKRFESDLLFGDPESCECV